MSWIKTWYRRISGKDKLNMALKRLLTIGEPLIAILLEEDLSTDRAKEVASKICRALNKLIDRVL